MNTVRGAEPKSGARTGSYGISLGLFPAFANYSVALSHSRRYCSVMQKNHPLIIQGGMGIGVSNWVLAKEVSRHGELGVVSGTCLNSVLIRRLQNGDLGGHCRRALAHFPDQAVSEEILRAYFLPEGKDPRVPYKRSPVFALRSPLGLLRLTVAANFVEVFLAKEGHDGLVGLNLLEKIQLPNLPSLYGAMLAGVDYVLMGAGIPREIPGALDRLALHEEAAIRLQVDGASVDDDHRVIFNPRKVVRLEEWSALKRPHFLPIVSSAVLAHSLAKKSTGQVSGFVIEHWTAGGHNAPPRGVLQLSPDGQPIYGQRDQVDFDKFHELGLPFWLAGSSATPQKLLAALELGATGIQVGTAFAFCNESGLSPSLKNAVREDIVADRAPSVYTDPIASPSGFPFKVVVRDGTLSESEVYQARPRKCDLGYLRTGYKLPSGGVGLRCPAEPIADFLNKGGRLEETHGRKCLCNGLFAAINMAQTQEDGYREAEIMTAGDDVSNLKRLFKTGSTAYSAADVIKYLRSELHLRQVQPPPQYSEVARSALL